MRDALLIIAAIFALLFGPMIVIYLVVSFIQMDLAWVVTGPVTNRGALVFWGLFASMFAMMLLSA